MRLCCGRACVRPCVCVCVVRAKCSRPVACIPLTALGSNATRTQRRRPTNTKAVRSDCVVVVIAVRCLWLCSSRDAAAMWCSSAGMYVFFDYESAWCRRIKKDFVFEYAYLEDELAV